ncbi:MAG: hypothetical protein BGP06_17560 [Rhizobiales bacterium 65-9]|nr:heavy-metal-associated domain-containing protein [Hyphomicrobiales bacterium]OJY40179.1 MAG: hypothetical protein BGP06_17560 [Rhizobiales bacterium 65-9]
MSEMNDDASAPTGAVTFKVADMTCGHCAAAIVKAVQTVDPGAKVAADPSSKTVSVAGAADAAAVERAIREAGYTPGAA